MRAFHLSVAAILLSGAVQGAPEQPPIAPEHPVTDSYFGTKVVDSYRWMENAQDPVLHKWVDAENRFAESYLARIPIRALIAKQLTGVWNFPDETVTQQVLGPRLFFERNAGLQNQ